MFIVKGCDSNFEINIFQMLKVATNETSTYSQEAFLEKLL